MTITGSTPERIDIDLHFEKPWNAHNRVRCDVGGTPQIFDKGLAQLKVAAENDARDPS